jgi:hypothetical protein
MGGQCENPKSYSTHDDHIQPTTHDDIVAARVRNDAHSTVYENDMNKIILKIFV